MYSLNIEKKTTVDPDKNIFHNIDNEAVKTLDLYLRLCSKFKITSSHNSVDLCMTSVLGNLYHLNPILEHISCLFS